MRDTDSPWDEMQRELQQLKRDMLRLQQDMLKVWDRQEKLSYQAYWERERDERNKAL